MGVLSLLGIGPATILLVVLIVLFLSTSFPLAFSTGLVGLIFTLGWFGPQALTLVTERMISVVTEYSLVAVPMFVLMASLLDRSGIAKDLFDSLKILAGKVRGGVAVQTVVVAFVMAAMSGIIGGEIVLLGIIALPQMLRIGYDKKLAIGTICAGGSLGTMVPPSIVLVIYGLVTSTSIGDLFLAAVPAATMLTTLYITYILIRCYINPSLAGESASDDVQKMSFKNALKNILAPIFIAVSVLGSIYAGIASVTEAASMGVLGVMIVVILRGEFSLDVVKKSLFQTFNTCGMIIWIVIGASMIVGIYNLIGGGEFVQSMILQMNVPSVVIILFMMFILVILGMFLDWTGIVMLTMPIFVPIIEQLGYDKIWFGILFAVNMQVSFLTPPFGSAAFFLKSVTPASITLKTIFSSFWPFIIMQLVVLTIIVFFPPSIMWIVGS